MFKSTLITLLLTSFLAACGGSTGDPDPQTQETLQPTQIPSEDQQQLSRELDWLYGKMKSEYLWYDETPDLDPQTFPSAAELLDAMVVKSKDTFSYLISAEQNSNIQNATSNTFGLSVLTTTHPWQILRVYEDGAAYAAGARRADFITHIEGIELVDEASGDAATALIQEALKEEGNSLEFSFMREDGETFVSTLQSQIVSRQTIDSAGTITMNNGQVIGYLFVSEWRAKTIDELRDDFVFFTEKNINSLIVDLRDNQGGLINAVVSLGSLILGSQPAEAPFIDFRFSDRGEEIFENGDFITRYNLSEEPNALTSIERVHVITSKRTCSASEMLINSLRPYVDVQVTGDTTCGKPYGFYGREFEDVSVLWAINFQADNAVGAGGWVDGIAPTCFLDEFKIYPYGDTRDLHLNSALGYLTTGACQIQTPSSEQARDSGSMFPIARPSYRPVYLHDPSQDRM